MTCTIAGSTKPSVFPEPVFARPITSKPLSAMGHAWLWMGVGALKPDASHSAVTYSGKAASRNVLTGFGARGSEQSMQYFSRHALTSRALSALIAGCSM